MLAGVDLELRGCDVKAQAITLFSEILVHGGASSVLQGCQVGNMSCTSSQCSQIEVFQALS